MHDLSPSRLPSHHVPRARLTSACAGHSIIVVEAAGGFGKSVLAAELIDLTGALPVWVLLEPGGVSADLLAARLRAAVAFAGLTDAAAAMARAGDDPPGAVDAMLAALREESFAIVVDDAHHADPDAAALVDRIAAGPIPPTGRLIVLARFLPERMARLRRAEVLHLDAGDLALRAPETLELCRTGFGLDVSADEASRLDAATGGWTAAAVLAISRSRQAAAPLAALAPAAATGGPLDGLAPRSPGRGDAIQAILEEALVAGGRDRERFARIAAPPLLDGELLAWIAGESGFLERLLGWGLPLYRTPDAWWVLPDPVREHLAALAPPDDSVLLHAAEHYRRRGALGTALRTLLAAGELDGAATLLDDADPWVIDTVDAVELLSVIDSLPQSVLDRHPRGLLKVARCLAGSWMVQRSRPLFAGLDRIVTADSAPDLRRALDVELLTEQLDLGLDKAEVAQQARRILDEVGPDEPLTRARALTVLGVALAGSRRADGTCDVSALEEAADSLARATHLQQRLGNRPAAATASMLRSMLVELPLGRPSVAVEVLDDGLAQAVDHPRRFAQLLYCRAHSLIELGLFADAERDLEEVRRISRRLGDRWLHWYVAWARMISASLRGEREEASRAARDAVVQGRGVPTFAYDASEFLADAADCLDRVGDVALAGEYADQARAQAKQAVPQIALADCALLARHGDPELARARLTSVPMQGIAPRELWRTTLFDAYAAWRLGDPGAAGLAARAFEQAAALGQPQAPLLRERELTETLIVLASQTGQPAARALERASPPIAVALLGRFELTRGGRPVQLGNSQEARLLKLVATQPAGVHVEQAIEALWPEVEPSVGRNRLRTVLNRLRDAAPGVVTRDGEQLAMGPDVRVDAASFAVEARQAVALRGGDPRGAVALARCAIARYRGALLPFDPYEPWSERPREAVEQTMLELLDLCAEVAADSGDLDEARRMVERTIELAPYDDERYLRVASILNAQGRKGAALSLLRRARAALAQMGVEPPDRLASLERTISAGGVRAVTRL